MRLGVKNRIVNSEDKIVFQKAGAVVASTGLLGLADVDAIVLGDIRIPIGTSTLGANHKVTAAAGTKGVYTITIGGGASAVGVNSVNLEIEIVSLRQEAEYSRYAWIFGKKIHFGVEVAASATATQIADALTAVINKRISRWGDLPFTVDAVSDADIVVTLTELDIKVQSAGISAADKDGRVAIPVTLAETTAPVSAIGTGAQVEEAVQMLTGKNALAGNLHAEDRVDLAKTYNKYYIEIPFTDAVTPQPSAAGVEWGASGKVAVASYVDAAISGNVITDLEALIELAD